MLRQLDSRSLGDEIAEVYSEPCQICKMVLFAKTLNGSQSLIIFGKSDILHV